MDILRHGQQVEVEQPPELRQRVADEAAALLKIYNKATPSSAQCARRISASS
jgi:hypothetical protein